MTAFHPRAFHPVAWMVWTSCAVVAVQTMTNPVALGVSVAAMLYTAMRLAPDRGPVMLMLKIGAFVIVTRVILFGLAGHPGGTILFSMPQWKLPALLGGFQIGGAISAEVLATAALEGARLAAVLVCFGVFLSIVEPARVLRLVPGFLFEAGMIVAIGVTFVPSLIRTARDVREAQRLRGYRARGVRAAVSIAMPVLSTTLERANAIAESMDSRGYGRALRSGGQDRSESRARIVAFAGILLASFGAIGWTMGLRPRGIPLASMLVAVAVLALACRELSLRVTRTRYRRGVMRAPDYVVAALAVGNLAMVIGFRSLFAYEAVPLHVPSVDVVAVGVACMLAAPVAADSVRGAWLHMRSRDVPSPAEDSVATSSLELESA
ncbi:MAG: CbiQ family ECF transporter T component [Actinomycetota bacterium]